MTEHARPSPAWTAPYRLKVALRLLRVRKINLISILGVMIGVGSIIVVMSVMDGFQVELRGMIRGTLSDLIVQLDPHDLEYEPLRKEVEAVPGVEAVTLQRHTFGAIPGENRNSDGGRLDMLPVRIVGILPEQEASVSAVLKHMDDGLLQGDDPFEVDEELLDHPVEDETPRIVVSSWIARRLGLYVGKVMVLIHFEEVTERGGTSYKMHDREVVVSRLYSSGNSEFDKFHVYVNLNRQARVFFPPGQGIAELRMRLTDYNRAPELRYAVARAVGKYDPRVGQDPFYFVETWEERQHNLLRAVNNEKFLLAFVLFFIVLVGCFTIFATLTMTVVEKTRDIGVLRALGATPGGILSIFILNGTLVGAFGAGLGYAAGMVVAHNVNPIRAFLRDNFGWDIFPPDIYLFDLIPSHIDHAAAVTFAVGAAFSALVFAIIPAIRAARLKPVSALRYE